MDTDLEFHSKNKFEKLVLLVGFIVRRVRSCNGVSNVMEKAKS